MASAITTTTSQKVLKALAARRHPDYDTKFPHWEFLESSYESGRDWFEKNIFQFTREGEKTHKGRVARAYRFNHTREVVDLVNKYLFKTPPKRSEKVPDYLVEFRKSATLGGLGVEDFERQVSLKSSIFGRTYVVVDSNAPTTTNGRKLSRAEAKKEGVKIYAYLVNPRHVLDFGLDKDGNFEWVLIAEQSRDDADPFESSGELRWQYRLWTKNDWRLFTTFKNGRIDETSSGTHGLGVVPVIRADHVDSDAKYSAPALIEDIAYLDRSVANYLSNLDQIINDQTFSILTMPAQGLLPGVQVAKGDRQPVTEEDELEERQSAAVTLSTSQVLLYDGEHGGRPEFISPDPKQAQLIITTIKQLINEIYHTVGLAGERTKQDNSAGIDNSSGVAKAFDFERVNALLSAKAAAMQSFANRLENMVRRYNGEQPVDEPAVLYSTHFDTRGLTDDMALASQFSLLNVPGDIKKRQMKAIIRKVWPLTDPAEIEKLDKAIDAWDDDPYSSANSVKSGLTDRGKEDAPPQSGRDQIGRPKPQEAE